MENQKKKKTIYTVIKQAIDNKKGQFIVQKNGTDEEYFGYGGFLNQKHSMDSVIKTVSTRVLNKISPKSVRATFTISEVSCEMDTGKQLILGSE